MNCPRCGALNPAHRSSCSACGYTPLGQPRPRQKTAQDLHSDPERRNITVVFCDIVGSTDLGSRLDLEDYREIIRAYHALCASAIESSGGWTAQFQGDGVIAYFGYPFSHEDDAVRAVRAGLRILTALEETNHRLLPGVDAAIDVRIAVHTGLVVTGMYSPEGATLVEGPALNLAKRLQEHAPHNRIVLSAETKDLVFQDFELSGPRWFSISGLIGEMALYLVERQHPSASGLERLSSRQLSTFIGRKAELDLLRDRLTQAKEGLGSLVLIAGEPGIGKSRLVLAFKNDVIDSGSNWLVAYCTDETANSAFLPLARLLQEELSIEPGHGAAEVLSRAAPRLADLDLLTDENRSVLVSFLGLSQPPDLNLVRFHPLELRKRILWFLKEYFVRSARQAPLILVIEDLHWIDASTFAFLESLVDEVRSVPLMIVGTLRHNAAAAQLGGLDATQIRLNPLTVPDAEHLLQTILGEATRSREQTQKLLEIAGGVPLFLEQYAYNLRQEDSPEDRASLPEDSDTEGIESAAVPLTLVELLQARLDRLGPHRPIAQAAAVIGQRFSAELLKVVSQSDEKVVDLALQQMTDLDIAYPRAVAVGSDLEFRHAFFQEVAYSTLLKSTRRQLHGRVAEALERHAGQGKPVRHEIIARHHAAANSNSAEKAISHWISAAEQSIGRSENVEAQTHIEHALSTLQNLPEAEARRTLEIRLRELLRVPLEATLGWAAGRTEKNLLRLRGLRKADSDKAELFSIFHGLCTVHGARGEISKALEYCDEMLGLVESTNDPVLSVITNRAFGMCHFFHGEFHRAIEHYTDVIRQDDPQYRHRYETFYPADPVIVALCMSGWAYGFLDDQEQALEMTSQALEESERKNHKYSRTYATGIASSVYKLFGQAEESLRYAEEGLTISEQNSNAYWSAWCKIMKGHASVFVEKNSDGIALLEAGIEDYRRTDARQILSYAYGLLAESYHQFGNDKMAKESLARADAEKYDSDVKFYDAHLKSLAQAFGLNKS